jgi:D-glycero-alpha-D-manno-heptose-7-phosphate kinase
MTTSTTAMTARVPLRVSFAGGGTDVDPYPQKHGGLVLTSTINTYVYANVWKTSNEYVEAHSLDTGKLFLIDDNSLNINLEENLLKASLTFINPANVSKFSYSVRSSVPPGSGLGASSAISVAVLSAIKSYLGTSLNAKDIARDACVVERDMLKISGGYQDQYACAVGGFNKIEFFPNRQVEISPLNISANFIADLEHNLLLLWTGTTRQGDKIIQDQIKNTSAGNGLEALHLQKRIAYEMLESFRNEDQKKIGHLLNFGWQAKKKFSTKISNSRIDQSYSVLLKAGATGGKLLGAGGGGFLLVLCPTRLRHKIAEVARHEGLQEYPLAFEKEGLKVWETYG